MARKAKDDNLEELYRMAAEDRAKRIEQEREERKAGPTRDWDAIGKKNLGRFKTISSPKMLWRLACAYFKDVEENPHKKKDFIKSGDMAGVVIWVEVHRPFTWDGFKSFLWVSGFDSDLDRYKYNEKGAYGEFVETVKNISSIMYAQKFEGASLGIYKEGIIARELGLKDQSRVEQEQTGPAFEPKAPTINIYNTAPPMAGSEAEIDLNRSPE